MLEKQTKTATTVDETPKFIDLRPVTDIIENNDGVTLQFEVPGVNAKNIELEVNNRILDLKAVSCLKRHDRTVRYKRAFQLAENIDLEQIKAQTQDGILEVFLPKSAQTQPYKILVS